MQKLTIAFKSIFASKTDLQLAVSTLEDSITAANTAVSNLRDNLSALGTFVGVSDTYSTLPTKDKMNKDINAGDLAYLTQDDGEHKLGLYKYNGTQYDWIAGAANTAQTIATLKATTLDDTVDNRFITPKWLKDYNASQEPTQDEINTVVNG